MLILGPFVRKSIISEDEYSTKGPVSSAIGVTKDFLYTS